LNKVEPIPWRGVRAIDKFFILAFPLAAVTVLVLSFLDESLLRRLGRMSGTGSILSWLVNGYNAWFVFAGLLLLFILSMIWLRHRIINDKRLWISSGCPDCNEVDLVRIKRVGSNRLYSLIGVPAFRYACRNCTWRGLRVARREYSPEKELAKEAALLRFDPDGPLLQQTEYVNGTSVVADPFEAPEIAIFNDESELDPFPEENTDGSGIGTADLRNRDSQLPQSQPQDDTESDQLDESIWLWLPDSDE